MTCSNVVPTVGHPEIEQGPGASFIFSKITKLTPPHKHSRSELSYRISIYTCIYSLSEAYGQF